ncbi:MAG: exonuclease SbcCD subunit D [Candidatus Eremiobacteraeota bacterium]|nr:exonuclease SbcCD subunit D [Candidatus Eremiobacteraeota bacterium]
MPRFIHMADLHLGAPFSFLGENKQKIRRKDLESAFTRAVDFALDPDNRIDGVWIAGDLFDMIDPPDDTVYRVKSEIERLNRGNIDVLLAPGTHDPSIYPESVYKKHKFKGLTILNDYNIGEPLHWRYGDRDFFFYGFEYHPIHSNPPFGKFQKTDSPGVHVAIIHGSLMLSNQWDIADAHVPLYPEDLGKTGMDYIALGHYHNFMEKNIGGSLVVYPGTLEGRKFSESGERFLVVVEFDHNNIRIEKIPWNRRIFQQVEINIDMEPVENETDIIKLIQEFSARGEDLLLRVKLTGVSEFIINSDFIRRIVSNKFFHFEIEDDTDILDSMALESIASEKTVRGLFIRNILGKLMDADEREEKVLKKALKLAMVKLQGGENLEI